MSQPKSQASARPRGWKAVLHDRRQHPDRRAGARHVWRDQRM